MRVNNIRKTAIKLYRSTDSEEIEYLQHEMRCDFENEQIDNALNTGDVEAEDIISEIAKCEPACRELACLFASRNDLTRKEMLIKMNDIISSVVNERVEQHFMQNDLF